MNELVRKTLEIEQHQCRSCGRLFYINTMDKSWLDLDFGCPYGCGDNGRHVRDIKTEVEQVKDDYRNKRITLKQLIVGLCAYEDSTYITKGYGLYLKMS